MRLIKHIALAALLLSLSNCWPLQDEENEPYSSDACNIVLALWLTCLGQNTDGSRAQECANLAFLVTPTCNPSSF